MPDQKIPYQSKITSKAIGGSMEDAAKKINNRSSESVSQYNIVYRQASTNLLVVAGIMLAFATTFVATLENSDIAIRILATGIIISLTLSLAFGILQQLMEAEYFRNHALRLYRLMKRAEIENITSPDFIQGAIDEIKIDRGNAVKRWASIVQLVLLGIALLLIVITTIYYLFIG